MAYYETGGIQRNTLSKYKEMKRTDQKKKKKKRMFHVFFPFYSFFLCSFFTLSQFSRSERSRFCRFTLCCFGFRQLRYIYPEIKAIEVRFSALKLYLCSFYIRIYNETGGNPKKQTHCLSPPIGTQCTSY